MKYLRWISRFVRRQRSAMAVMMICHVLLAGCAVGFVYVSKKLVDISVAVLQGAESGDLWVWASAMITIVLVRVGLNALRSYLQIKTEIRLKIGLRRKLFDILLRMQSDGGNRRHTGDILNRMQEDVRVVSNVCAASLPNMFGTFLQLAAAFVFLMLYSLSSSLALFLTLGLAFLLLHLVVDAPSDGTAQHNDDEDDDP